MPVNAESLEQAIRTKLEGGVEHVVSRTVKAAKCRPRLTGRYFIRFAASL